MENVKVIYSTKRQPSKSDTSTASSNVSQKLFACSKMEVHRKEIDNKKLRIRQKYGKSVSEHETKPRTFVTKVQIKSKRPVSVDDKVTTLTEQQAQTPRLTSARQEAQSKPRNENEGDEIPPKFSANHFWKPPLISSSEDAIDLLWADEYPAEKEKQEYLEINKLVRYLSRRQRESSTFLYRFSQRPTASFARPTKGEVSVWMKSPANESNTKKPFLTRPRDQDLTRSRSRAWSLPFYHCHSSSSDMKFEQSQCLEIGRPSSVPMKKIPPR